MQHDCYGRTGYCPPAPPAALIQADLVFALARARRATSLFRRTRYCPCAPSAALRRANLVFALARARRATSLLWANRVLPPRTAVRLETNVSGFCARTTCLFWADLGIACVRRLPLWDKQMWFLRAAGHPFYGQTGYCLRAPPADLRRGDLAFAHARGATSLLWANRVLSARAACCLETGGSGFYCPRGRAFRLETGTSCCGARVPRGARHPCYGRTGYCPRGRAGRLETGGSCCGAPGPRAARHPCYGRTGYCPRGRTRRLQTGGSSFCARATSLLWANSVMHERAARRVEAGGSGFRASALRPGRAPRDIPVMGEAGIAPARRVLP